MVYLKMESYGSQQNWQFSILHSSPCKVIEEQTLWGQPICRVWLPNQDAVVRVPRSDLQPLNTELRPDYWVLVDEFRGHGEHTVETLFKFAPKLDVSVPDGSVVLAKSSKGPTLTIQPSATAKNAVTNAEMCAVNIEKPYIEKK